MLVFGLEVQYPLKGSQLGTFCPKAIIVYCYLEFKLHYLKNLELFSIRELFEPIVLRKKKKKKKGQGVFCSF